MSKKTMIILISMMALLVACIALMSVSLLIRERSFGMVSGYIAIAAIVITVVGVVILMVSNKHNKQNK